jgi:hypothetical protein
MNNKVKSRQDQENRKLNVFIGKWHTTGDIYGKLGEITGHVDAIDTYAWLPGEYAIIHYIDSLMGDVKVHGIEIIGYNMERQAYFVPFFDNQGSVGSEELRLEDETWIWSGENVMGVKFHRCTAVFETENLVIAHHEYSDDNKIWRKWMDIKLRKTD